MAHSTFRPLGDKRPIGTAVTEMGARRVYWQWEVKTYQPGQRWQPKTMEQDANGDWFLGDAARR